MSNPQVSVIMPTYNCADLVGESIQSVLNQTFQDFELVIVDDGSSDNTREVVSKYLADDRLTLLNERHRGSPAIARTIGISKARGKYIAFLDSDDLWVSHTLDSHLRFLAENSTIDFQFSDYVHFQMENGCKKMAANSYFKGRGDLLATLDDDYIARRDESYVVFSPRIRALLMTRNFVHTSTVIVSSRSLEAVGGFDVNLVTGEDWDLWIRLLQHFDGAAIDATLCEKRLWPGSITVQKQTAHMANLLELQQEFLTDLRLPRRERNLLLANISERAYDLGTMYFSARHFEPAMLAFDQARRYRHRSARLNLYRLLLLIPERLLNILLKVKDKCFRNTTQAQKARRPQSVDSNG